MIAERGDLQYNLPCPLVSLFISRTRVIVSISSFHNSLLLFIQRRFLPYSKFLIFKFVFRSNKEKFELFRSRIPHLFRSFGLYEQVNLDILSRFIKNGDTVCDIGASYGVYCREMSDLVGPSGKVFAVEPQPAVMSLLKQYCASRKNIDYRQIGVSDREETIELQIPLLFGTIPETSMASTNLAPDLPFTTLTLHGHPLDSFYEDLKGLSFIKVDIEGHEQSFLRGAERIIRDFRPVIQFEENNLQRLSDSWPELAKRLGYSVYALNRKRELILWGSDDSISLAERNFYLIPN